MTVSKRSRSFGTDWWRSPIAPEVSELIGDGFRSLPNFRNWLMTVSDRSRTFGTDWWLSPNAPELSEMKQQPSPIAPEVSELIGDGFQTLPNFRNWLMMVSNRFRSFGNEKITVSDRSRSFGTNRWRSPIAPELSEQTDDGLRSLPKFRDWLMTVSYRSRSLGTDWWRFPIAPELSGVTKNGYDHRTIYLLNFENQNKYSHCSLSSLSNIASWDFPNFRHCFFSWYLKMMYELQQNAIWDLTW